LHWFASLVLNGTYDFPPSCVVKSLVSWIFTLWKTFPSASTLLPTPTSNVAPLEKYRSCQNCFKYQITSLQTSNGYINKKWSSHMVFVCTLL
jgi:hypothetical protein